MTTTDDAVFAHAALDAAFRAMERGEADVAIAQAMLPYLLTIARHGVEAAMGKCPDLARGVYTLQGRLR